MTLTCAVTALASSRSGVPKAEIEAAIDVSTAFTWGAAEHPPNTADCFDRLYSMKLYGEASDWVSKEIPKREGKLSRNSARSHRRNFKRHSGGPIEP